MGKKIIIIGLAIILILMSVVYAISKVVKITGPVVWIDRSNRGNWQHNANAGAWWGELSILNPNMIDQSRWVVVYLLPNLQTSQTSFGRKDQPPAIFVDWRVWGKGIQVLTISINWDEWEDIEADDRQKQLSQFVASQLGKYWGAPKKDELEMTNKVLRGEVEPPINLTWKEKGAE